MERPNHLAFGGLLVSRLRAELTDIRNIGQRGELDEVISGSGQGLPAIAVIYRGDLVRSGSEQAAGGTRIVQQWLVVVAVKVAGAPDRALLDAGDLLGRVRGAVLDWFPGHEPYGAIEAATPPQALYLNGCGFFPLAFNVDFYA
ncbi:hypothetical protein NH8B_2111 [Pseudogulbenkiania sp. NH8B]|uniref:phage tail terminator protein n=1 Tax=Pseudogulbenkiania sp. (strain NH8B) TaxID=748280 RepID=UPI0002279B5C|nr:hypothetical protein [Pseudogulbenkiania sp. NH8B]BAK76497.1 hypothetical protein NH8B_1680 [Pseudogulbenkiania sp. NH8B]BAK76926.1 hypothetical protein NH8B_2111 [Pseudogulbenkiania sp. NH8B]